MSELAQYRKLSAAKKNDFINDLVNFREFAKRKEISETSVVYAVKTGRIAEGDIFVICGHKYIEWSRYRSLAFSDYNLKKG